MSDTNIPASAEVIHEVKERNQFLVGLGYSFLVGVVGYGIAYLTHNAFDLWAIDFFRWVSSIFATISTSIIFSFMSFGIYGKNETYSSLAAVFCNCIVTLIVFFATQNW